MVYAALQKKQGCPAAASLKAYAAFLQKKGRPKAA
jgi:hypothetical protein